MWVVYESPADYPGKFVARMFIPRGGEARPTNAVVVGDTLDSVRAYVPGHLHCIGRMPGDAGSVVECWI